MSCVTLSVNKFTPSPLLTALLGFPSLARSRVADIVFAQTEEPWELMLSLTAALWGAWVASPFWDAFANSPIYAVLGQIAPREYLGVYVLLVGVVRFLLLVYRLAPWRHYFAIVSLCTWAFIWMCFVLSNPASTATVIYLLPVGASALVFLRLGRP